MGWEARVTVLARMALLVLALSLVLPADAQQTSGWQSPAISAGRDVIVTYGFAPEQVRDLTKAAASGAIGPLADRIVDFSQKLGVTQERGIDACCACLDSRMSPSSNCLRSSGSHAQYKQAIERVAALDPQDPVTRDLVTRAQAEITAGHLEEADQLLSQAEQAEVAAAHQAQQLAQQAQAAARSSICSMRPPRRHTGQHRDDRAALSRCRAALPGRSRPGAARPS